jgi:hypothetical protein
LAQRLALRASAQLVARALSLGWPHVASPAVLPMPVIATHAPSATPARHSTGARANGAPKPLAQQSATVSARAGSAGPPPGM